MPYAHVVGHGENVDLADFDPDDHAGLGKQEAEEKIEKLGKQLGDLQELLFAAHRHSLLVVLQGIDTSGKDGSIRSLLSFGNVQSCRVSSFKVPTPQEASHDFLWRIHANTPGQGEISIFNRSHYEDVIVARVHELVPKKVWKERYDHINRFEELLHDSQTLIVKFFLHISKREQEERLLAREADVEKAWKLSVGDWEERKLWSEYKSAYEDALLNCSPKIAPWRIVPANHKWFRDLAITEAIVNVLEPYEKEWQKTLAELGKKEKAELKAFRAK